MDKMLCFLTSSDHQGMGEINLQHLDKTFSTPCAEIFSQPYLFTENVFCDSAYIS